jgi:hypothetical protein
MLTYRHAADRRRQHGVHQFALVNVTLFLKYLHGDLISRCLQRECVFAKDVNTCFQFRFLVKVSNYYSTFRLQIFICV